MITNHLYEKYLKKLLEGDKSYCSNIVSNLLTEEINIKQIYQDLFQRSLYEVGELWEYNKITVSHEHLATAITENLMNLLLPKLFEQEHLNKSVIVSSINSEFHQIGARMVADIFEFNGWHSYYLGSNIPTKDLLELINDKNVDILAISVTMHFNLPFLDKVIDIVHDSYPDLTIIIGGLAFKHEKMKYSKNNQVMYIHNLDDLEIFIKKF